MRVHHRNHAQHVVRDQRPIRNDDTEGVRAGVRDEITNLMNDWDAQLAGDNLHRTRGRLTTTSSTLVDSGEYTGDLEARLMQRAQGPDGNFRCAGIDDSLRGAARHRSEHRHDNRR